MKTTEKIIKLLKTNGSLTAKSLAEALQMTTMGVRQHMQQLEEEEKISYQDIKAIRGRPTRYWSLTEKSNSHFSNGHEELTVQLIDSVKTIFGDEGLNKLISHREKVTFAMYQQALAQQPDLFSQLNTLAKLRNDEGYMASIESIDGDFWLIENHCPICAAATKCQNFCRSELELFQALFKDKAKVSRQEHIIEGARRCAYKITSTS
jgi:predicted ArsR family transcriptional regulator